MQPGELIHVAGPVWLLAGERKGRFPRSHSVVIQDGDTALIDTGAGLEVLRPWAEPGRVDLVLNTHSHLDHSAGNWLFGCPVWAPEQAWRTSGRLERLAERFVLPEMADYWKQFILEETGMRDRAPDGKFGHGQEITVGSTVLRVVHTPGHTIDHCCFHLPQYDLVISADIDLTGFGPWYGHAESDLEQFRDGVEAVRALRPKVLVTSHTPPWTQGIDQALTEYAAKIAQREAAILDLLRQRPQGWTLDELADQALIYGSFPWRPRLLAYFEGQMIERHLAELRARGLASLRDGVWRAEAPSR